MATKRRGVSASIAFLNVAFAAACVASGQSGTRKPASRRDARAARKRRRPNRTRSCRSASLITQVNPAIVEVRTEHGRGSGFVIDADKAWVATNFHVVSGATKGNVVFASDNQNGISH